MKRTDRRQFLHWTASASAIWSLGCAHRSTREAPVRAGDVASRPGPSIHFEVHGPEDGIPLFLGFPIMASYLDIFGEVRGDVRSGYLEGLTDRYRVLLVDYPNVGRTHGPEPDAMTADRVTEDLLRVADAAGFERFSYCGFLWGAVNGLLLASRTDRVKALVCGTWPPLGAPYADMLRGVRIRVAEPPPHAMVILREPSQYAQWVTYYQSLEHWSEAEALARIDCARLAVIGGDAEAAVAGIPLHLVETIRERRAELEALGWEVEIVPGQTAAMMLDPQVMVPILRRFLG